MGKLMACGLALLVAVAACGDSEDATTDTTGATTRAESSSSSTLSTIGIADLASTRFVAEVWADNWFAFYVNGKLVGEDSVPLTTERSFNAERLTFEATYPLTIAIVAKDYVANESGLEYVGTDRQQIGDGGVIAQIRDEATGSVVAATTDEWKAFVVEHAPVDPLCATSTDPLNDCEHESHAIPTEWSASAFDDSRWSSAGVFSEADVQPHGDYTTVTWDNDAALLWAGDLRLDNVVLLRSPPIPDPAE